MIRCVLVLALGAAIGATPLIAQNNATIAGRVVDKTSKAAIVGAEVLLAPGARRLVSDETGAFRFDLVSPGHVTILVRRLGRDDARQRRAAERGRPVGS